MEKYTIVNNRFGYMYSVLYYQKWGKFYFSRRTNTDTVENHFGNPRQSVGGGNATTVIMQRTNDARSSIYNTTTGLTKGNNASALSFH